MKDILDNRIKKKRNILFNKEDEIIQEILNHLNELSKKGKLLFLFDLCSERVIELEKKYPNESRLRNCVDLSKDWAFGKIKMKEAKQAILQCHSFAKEIDCKEDISLIHAIAQGCSSVHTMGHLLGFPIYDLTYVYFKEGIEGISSRVNYYYDKIEYWKIHECEYKTWASFIE